MALAGQRHADPLHHVDGWLMRAECFAGTDLSKCLLPHRDHLTFRNKGKLRAAGARDTAAAGWDGSAWCQRYQGNTARKPAQK